MSDKLVKSEQSSQSNNTTDDKQKTLFEKIIAVPVTIFGGLVLFFVLALFVACMSDSATGQKATKELMDKYDAVVSESKLEIIGSKVEDLGGVKGVKITKLIVKDVYDGLETSIRQENIFGNTRGGVNWSVGDIKVVDKISYINKETGEEEFRGYALEGEGQSIIDEYKK